eukprot:scaffold2498_cov114-Isochrysis_galbana.AAC.2
MPYVWEAEMTGIHSVLLASVSVKTSSSSASASEEGAYLPREGPGRFLRPWRPPSWGCRSSWPARP